MSNSNSTNYNGGIGFIGLLTIVFITLKLTSHINWSWWWVLAPAWGPVAIVLGIAVVAFCTAGLIWAAIPIAKYISRRKPRKVVGK